MASRTVATRGFQAAGSLLEARPAPAATATREQHELKRIAEWTSDYRNLCHREATMDKAGGPHDLPESLGRDAFQIGKEAADIDAERQGLILELAGRLQRLKGVISSLQERIRNVRPGPEYLKEVAGLMDESENDLNELRADQREHYRILSEEERALSHEMEVFWRNEEAREAAEEAEAEARRNRGAPPSTSRAAAAAAEATEREREDENAAASGLHPDVLAFDEFHDRFGPCGGWHPDDHAEWCRILSACRNDYRSAIEVASKELLGLSPDQVEEHARWDARYRDLQFKKRAAVQLWRARKEIDRQRNQPAVTTEESLLRAAEEREARRREEEEYRHRQRQALEAWRGEQQGLARAQAEREAARWELQERKDAEARAKQAEKKAVIEAYRLAKEAEQRRQMEARVALQREASSASTPRDPEALARLHERDLEIVQKRKQVLEEKERARREARERVEELARAAAVEAPRDPARLLRPTSAAAERVKAERETITQGFIRHVPRLATPSWRKGL